jgi:hypothetical protein
MFQARTTSDGNVKKTDSRWRLEIGEGGPSAYRLAQLDDYAALARSRFKWREPTTLSLRCRVSQPNLPGTWGFGFWNDPFTVSLGLQGMARRLPALPNACWFFHASAENHLSFTDSKISRFWNKTPRFSDICREEGRILVCESAYALSHTKMRGLTTGIPKEPTPTPACPDGRSRGDVGVQVLEVPANGFLAQTFRSPRIPSALLAPGILGSPLLLARPLSRWLRANIAGKLIREDAQRLSVDVTEWHTYNLKWNTNYMEYAIDGEKVFETQVSPKGPLGLVIWIDNQYAAWRPDGSLGMGVLANPPAWMEIENLEVRAL